MTIDFRTTLLAGIARFNAREFWHAHEVWEDLWRPAKSIEMRRFLQGLIQLAAAYHHLQRGTLRGGVRLFDAALDKLATIPHDYCGIARTTLEAAAREHREWAAAACATQGDDGEMRRDSRLDDERFPRIALVAESVTQVPAPDDW